MKNIKLLVLDVDGTMTDGKLYIDDKDNAMKSFDVKDGFAIVNWLKLGGEILILTGKKSIIVERRAKELGIKYLIQDSKNKTEDLKKILDELGLQFDNVAYMGDDINDMGVMSKVKLSACPRNAVSEVQAICNYKSEKNGGDGAVRDFLEYIMKNNGMWQKVIEKYMNE